LGDEVRELKEKGKRECEEIGGLGEHSEGGIAVPPEGVGLRFLVGA
jgi:hypothetical protein